MTASDVIQIIDYTADKSPLLTIPIFLFIVIIGYVFAKRFLTTDYIKENKESREQLKQVEDSLRAEVERLNKRIKELESEKDYDNQRYNK